MMSLAGVTRLESAVCSTAMKLPYTPLWDLDLRISQFVFQSINPINYGISHEELYYRRRIMKIEFDKTNYELNFPIEKKLLFEDGNYIISNELLNITAWGDTIEEAEEAFAFSFFALYQNYAKKDDNNLTSDAKSLKSKLLELVKREI